MNDLYGFNKKKLGFGLMRLPKTVDGEIDEKRTAAMVDRFLSEGFTYFDTAYSYPGSEDIFRKTVSSRHDRNEYTIATKLPSGMLAEGKTPEELFQTQLERTGLEYFDFYLLHAISESNINIFNKSNAWEFGKRMKAEGKIRHLGFSFHDTPEMLDRILTEHPEAEFVQLQINYLDWTSPRVQSCGVYEIARKHNKPIIIMEPVKGGILSMLNENLTEPFRKLSDASPASYALRYVAGLDGILAILSGMSTEEQLEDNIKTFSPVIPLTEKEKDVIAKVKEAIEELQTIECTACKYCVPGCPKKIDIPSIFRMLNDEAVLSDKTKAKTDYANLIKDGTHGRASECIKCGKCEKTCPQKLPIRELLSKAEAKLI